jgi:hypothetical protein
MSFVILFFYFEMRENAYSQLKNNETFWFLMKKHYYFYFVLLPTQFLMTVYLTVYETRKMIATKDKWQLFIVVFNFWQVFMPFFDHSEFIYYFLFEEKN